MELLIAVYLFIIGAACGSFVGAMVWRVHKGKKLAKDRSECEHCHHVLSPLDLVPVISWLWLRGKCRYCRKPIGIDLLVLEVVLGVLFVISYYFWPFGFFSGAEWMLFGVWLVILTGLAFLFDYDRRHFLLPDKVVFPLMGLSLPFFIYWMGVSGDLSAGRIALELLLALLPISGVYGFLYLISSGKWVGLGDVKLGVVIGFLLGWQGALLVLFLANVLGTIYVLPGLLKGTQRGGAHVPFGPFLIAATFLTFFWGGSFVAWYTNLLL